jgi:RimJ/RimL family protein N-acetyltransferase
MIQAPENLVTERLVLRRPAMTDAPAVYDYGGDPDVTRYLIFPTHASRADAEEFLRTCPTRWDSGEEFCWLIHPNVSPEPRDCYVYAKVRGEGGETAKGLDHV